MSFWLSWWLPVDARAVPALVNPAGAGSHSHARRGSGVRPPAGATVRGWPSALVDVGEGEGGDDGWRGVQSRLCHGAPEAVAGPGD